MENQDKALVSPDQDRQKIRERQQEKLVGILPQPPVSLTAEQKKAIDRYQQVIHVLGPAGAAPMICSKQCPAPIRSTCPLAAIGKEPIGFPCPFETQMVVDRYFGYLEDLDRTEEDVTTAEKSLLGSLVALDLQERRCNQALSYAENALMASLCVRNVDRDGHPIAYEEIVHANATRLDQILERKQEILTALELTPESQTKRIKFLSGVKPGSSASLAARQSKLYEKIFGRQGADAVDITPKPDEKPKPPGRKKKNG